MSSSTHSLKGTWPCFVSSTETAATGRSRLLHILLGSHLGPRRLGVLLHHLEDGLALLLTLRMKHMKLTSRRMTTAAMPPTTPPIRAASPLLVSELIAEPVFLTTSLVLTTSPC